jgi:archaellin
MKKYIPIQIMTLLAAFVFSAGLIAQEKTEVSIQVKKDGKVVKDTTYEFDDAKEAKHVLKMVEIMSGEKHMEGMHYNYTMAHSGEGHSKAMVFISEDGKKTEIKKIEGDSLVWVSEGDGESFNVWVDEDGDKDMKKKKIKVVVSGDEEGNWTAVEADEKHLDKEENVYFISDEDDIKVEIREIIEESGDGEEVKVIVIKKEIEKEHDEDHDVEKKVIKKKVKKQ